MARITWRLHSLMTLVAIVSCGVVVRVQSPAAKLAPTGTLRAVFLGGNPVQGRVDARTGDTSGTVPDLTQLISNDPKAEPPDEYAVLSDVLDWATNVGYPGYASAAIDETFNTWIINTMFAKAATGAETPENALDQAEKAMKSIWEKWKDRGMI